MREPSAFELMLQERGLVPRTDERGGRRDAIDDEIDDLERRLGMHKKKKKDKGGDGAAADDDESFGDTVGVRGSSAAEARGSGSKPVKAAPGKSTKGAMDALDELEAGLSDDMTRRLRGLLNKLTEQSIGGVSADLAELFSSGSSRELARAFAKALLSGCISQTQLLAPLVLLSAALVRALSIRLGQNVLTALVEATVKAFEQEYGAAQSGTKGSSSEASEHVCSNTALLLAHLYNFGALHASLLYELIRRLVAGFGEADLQTLIVLLRAVGSQLRADDPNALKEIILDVQSRSTASASGQSARARVFVSMLMDLKNNKQQRAAEQGAADGSLGRLKKWLKTLTGGGSSNSGSSSSSKEPPPFKVGWDELLQAETRGRWWVIGSAWAGRSAGSAGATDANGAAGDARKPSADTQSKLMALAESQRMNTDIRKRIFVAIMGAEDFVDAHTRIVKLKLKKGQQPEIVRVLLECAGQEAVFNRFYALLCERVSESYREVRFALSFAFWDVFKQLPELALLRSANTSKLLAHLVHRGTVPISVLKVVNWSQPSKRAIFFWQVFFIELLGSSSATAQRTALEPLLTDASHAELRDGVLLFLERHVRKAVKKQHPTLTRTLRDLVGYLDGS